MPGWGSIEWLYDLQATFEGRSIRLEPERENAEVLAGDLCNLEEREGQHFVNARSVSGLPSGEGWVYLVVGCCDGRVTMPSGINSVYFDNDRLELAVMHLLPVIGGGVPDEEMLRAMVTQYKEKGINPKKIKILTTQHGSTEEVDACLQGEETEVITCGARAVKRDYEQVARHLPLGLKERLSRSVYSADMCENGDLVAERVGQMIDGWGGGLKLELGYYDHNKKIIYTDNGVMRIGGMKEWHKPHQDPKALIVSVGQRAVSLPDGVLFPSLVGDGTESNDFNAAAVSKDGLRKALGEMWYAMHHHAEGHDANFASVDLMVIACDGDQEIEWLRGILEEDEFSRDYAHLIQKLGGIYAANLETKKVELVTFKLKPVWECC